MFIVDKKPKSIAAESYRTLRTNIQYSSLIMFTSLFALRDITRTIPIKMDRKIIASMFSFSRCCLVYSNPATAVRTRGTIKELKNIIKFEQCNLANEEDGYSTAVAIDMEGKIYNLFDYIKWGE